MKPGKSGATGHMVEYRTCKGKDWRLNHWDFEKKAQVDDGPATFAYCVDCDQYAWGWKSICPMNSKIVTYKKVIAI